VALDAADLTRRSLEAYLSLDMARKALILTTEPPEQPGGLERYVSYLVRGLEARGYEVRICHRENTWPTWFPRKRSSRASRLLTNAIQGLFIGRAAARMIPDGVDLVVSNSTAGWYPLLGKKTKKAHIYHGTYWGLANAMREDITTPGYFILKFWDCQVLERLGAVGKACLVNSEQTREEVRRVFGYDAKTVWCPLDLNHFRPRDRTEARSRLGIPEGRPVILFAGHALGMKGFSVVRALMERFPDASWLLVIRGPVPPELKGQAHVTVVQNAGYDDMPWVYSAADVSLVPSKYESFGYVVAEALACGTPVVSSPGGASTAFCDVSPLDDLVIADAKNVNAFELAVRAVLAHPLKYRRAIEEHVRPRLLALHDDDAWWRRFFAAVDEGTSATG
jgi:glycosyltransferase involved in cell wall biosynthesis